MVVMYQNTDEIKVPMIKKNTGISTDKTRNLHTGSFFKINYPEK